MTLTDALRAALNPATHASNLTPLRQIVAHVVTDPADAPRGLVSRVLLFGLAPLGEGGHFAAEIPEIVMCCVNAGADLDDFRTVINEPAVAPEMPRSAEWTAAALRLAAWADGEVTPEPAPWDDPFTPTPPQSDADPYPPPPWAKVEIAGQIVPADVTFPDPPPSTTARNFRCIPDPPTFRGVVSPPQPAEITVSFNAEATCPGEEPIPVRAVVTWATPRRIFAAVALDGSGVWAIGDTAEEARVFAGERRQLAREDAQALDLYFPDASTDTAWLDTLALVTMSGTTEGLRALIRSMETGDSVVPWCPADLWDNPEPVKEP